MSESLQPFTEYEVTVRKRAAVLGHVRTYEKLRDTVTTAAEKQYDYLVTEGLVRTETVVLNVVLPHVDVETVVQALFPPSPR